MKAGLYRKACFASSSIPDAPSGAPDTRGGCVGRTEKKKMLSEHLKINCESIKMVCKTALSVVPCI